MKLVVIFGAGASHDVIDRRRFRIDERYRPPLTPQLVDPGQDWQAQHVQKFWPAKPLWIRAGNAVSRDENLEAFLAEEYERAAGDDDLAVQVAAMRLYIRSVIAECTNKMVSSSHGATNYVQLVDTLNRYCKSNDGDVTYITFNYDTLLESAIEEQQILSRAGNGLDWMISDRRTKIIKPHGSIDWYHVARYIATAPGEILNQQCRPALDVRDLEISPQFVRLPEDRTLLEDGTGYYVPAISIPIAGKDAFECPASHSQHAFKTLLSADSVLTIGWSAGDTRFLADWKASQGPYPKPVHCVAHDAGAANAVGVNLSRARINVSTTAADVNGFSEFLRTGAFERWLAEQRPFGT